MKCCHHQGGWALRGCGFYIRGADLFSTSLLKKGITRFCSLFFNLPWLLRRDPIPRNNHNFQENCWECHEAMQQVHRPPSFSLFIKTYRNLANPIPPPSNFPFLPNPLIPNNQQNLLLTLLEQSQTHSFPTNNLSNCHSQSFLRVRLYLAT